MLATRSVCIVATILAPGVGVVCKSSTRSSSGNPAANHVDLSLGPSARKLMGGVTVPLIDRSARIARVKPDQPGAYTVSDLLMVDGREAHREAAEVRARPWTEGRARFAPNGARVRPS